MMKSVFVLFIFLFSTSINFSQTPKQPEFVFTKNTTTQSWKKNESNVLEILSMIEHLKSQIDKSTSVIKSFESKSRTSIRYRKEEYEKLQSFDFYSINTRSTIVKILLRNLSFSNIGTISKVKPNYGFAIGIAKYGKLVQIYFPNKPNFTTNYNQLVDDWIKLDIQTRKGERNIRFLIEKNVFKLDEKSKKEKIKTITGLNESYFENLILLEENKSSLDNLTKNFTQVINNQYTYYGTFDNVGNKKFGVLLDQNKDTLFIGEWFNNLPNLNHGKLFLYETTSNYTVIQQGNLIWRNTTNSAYVGALQNNVYNGNGICVYNNGQSYNGEFLNGQRSGNGTYSWDTGANYKGEWKYDRQDGMGVYVSSTGTRQEGLFQNGNFIRSNWELQQDRIAEQNRIAEQERIEEQNRIAEENRKLEQQRMVAEMWEQAFRESRNNTNNRSNQQTQQTQTSTCSSCSGSGRCGYCNKTFKMGYIGNRCSYQQNEKTNLGFIKCETCRGFGFLTTSTATKCNCPDGIGICYDKDCYVSNCNNGWVPCRECNSKGVCNSCKGTGRR